MATLSWDEHDALINLAEGCTAEQAIPTTIKTDHGMRNFYYKLASKVEVAPQGNITALVQALTQEANARGYANESMMYERWNEEDGIASKPPRRLPVNSK